MTEAKDPGINLVAADLKGLPPTTMMYGSMNAFVMVGLTNTKHS